MTTELLELDVMVKETDLINIVIVEDNAYMRQGWTAILEFEDDFNVLGAFESFEDSVKSGLYKECDVAIMDIELPGMSGIEGVRYLKKENPDVHVVMATVFDDDKHVFDALVEGAVGYLMKKTSPADLCDAIRIANTGGSPMTPEIARKVIRSFQSDPAKDESTQLNERELQILKELSSGKSYQSIANDIFLSVDGVRYHIRNIYQKMQVNSRSEAVARGIKDRLI